MAQTQKKTTVKKDSEKEVKAKAPVKKTEHVKEPAHKAEPVKETAKTHEHKPVEHKAEAKTTVKSEVKHEAKPKRAAKKFILKEKKENKTKSPEAKAIQKTLEAKKRLPTFRGRFGKKNIRRASNEKWQKWRKPRSIDLDRGLQHGFTPKIGYRNKASIRGIHPSGYVEVRVENSNDLKNIDIKLNAIRISATVGKRKRNEIIKEANKKGIWILN
ncbi:MAG: eL32 family ribosomal protein [archaeon]|jgi:large subunit ribosomal protein L32e